MAYDSSMDTLKHIERVGYYEKIYKDALNHKIITDEDINCNIDDMTLLAILTLLIQGEDIPPYCNLFTDINENSKIYKLGTYHKDKLELLKFILEELDERAIQHDKSKLEDPEKPYFDIWTPRIQEAGLGSDLYKYFLEQLKPALIHHYRVNRHHFQHFGNGINGMTITDLSEVLWDWNATCDRHEDGNIYYSIDYLSKEHGYSKEMVKVLSNTCEKYFNKSK
jgi:hypothetical protein